MSYGLRMFIRTASPFASSRIIFIVFPYLLNCGLRGTLTNNLISHKATEGEKIPGAIAPGPLLYRNKIRKLHEDVDEDLLLELEIARGALYTARTRLEISNGVRASEDPAAGDDRNIFSE